MPIILWRSQRLLQQSPCLSFATGNTHRIESATQNSRINHLGWNETFVGYHPIFMFIRPARLCCGTCTYFYFVKCRGACSRSDQYSTNFGGVNKSVGLLRLVIGQSLFMIVRHQTWPLEIGTRHDFDEICLRLDLTRPEIRLDISTPQVLSKITNDPILRKR